MKETTFKNFGVFNASQSEEIKAKKVGPTGKPWTRDDQEMHDFEASREDKF